MGPKPVDDHSDHDLFRTELINLIDHRHELVKLGEPIGYRPPAEAEANYYRHLASQAAAVAA